MFFPVATRMLISSTWYSWGRVIPIRSYMSVITVIFFLAMWVLNMYWYILVVKGLLRLLGITKGSSKKKDKKVEKKED